VTEKEFRVCKTCGRRKPLDEFTSAISTNPTPEDCKECRKGKHYTLVFAGDIETQEKAHHFLKALSHSAAIARQQKVRPDIASFIAEYSALYGSPSRGRRPMHKISDYRCGKIEELLEAGKNIPEIAEAYGFTPDFLNSRIVYREKKKKKRWKNEG